MNIQNLNILDYFDYNAFVTLTMFFISLFVLLLDKISKGKTTRLFFSTERASLLNPLTYIRFFTHILGHADWSHLSSNYLKILLLGPLIEEKYGSINYLAMILITALIVGIFNFIKGISLRHLLHCTRDKVNMSILHLNNNLLGENCGENLAGILTNLNNLNELNLSCNCIGDAPIPLILNPLKKNATIEILYLGCNDIGPSSASYLAAFLSNNRNLKTLTLNDNPLTAAGIKSISQALSTKLVLEEINLNSTAAGDEGGAELFENMKLNKSLRRVYANNNKFFKNSMFKFGELLKKDNDDQNSEGGLEFLSLSGNDINDECINFFAQDLISYKWLKEIKFNSNKITEKGGEGILFAVLQNENINQVNLENNNANWNFTIEELKSYRDNINVYL